MKENVASICVILVDRANYGRLKPVMQEMKANPKIELQIVCTGTMALDRFGRAVDIVREDGFIVAREIYVELEGSLPITMVKSLGFGVIEIAGAINDLDPDFALIIGDRYEALSAVIATVFQNKCLIHLQGGEVSGSIDESTRHAITKMAHYHFPATERSAKFITAMGEDPDTVFCLGCPSVDVVEEAKNTLPTELLERLGVGPQLNLDAPYILALFHPVTTECMSAEAQMEQLLESLRESNMQIILIWPNIDAGSDGISQAIRRFREKHHDVPLHAYKNFEPEVYIPLLGRAVCAVGNSSSFVRDASFMGTPVVLVGSRQDGREWAESVLRVEPVKNEILSGIRKQIEHGPYSRSDIYGSPGVAKKISDKLVELKPYQQKRLFY